MSSAVELAEDRYMVAHARMVRRDAILAPMRWDWSPAARRAASRYARASRVQALRLERMRELGGSIWSRLSWTDFRVLAR